MADVGAAQAAGITKFLQLEFVVIREANVNETDWFFWSSPTRSGDPGYGETDVGFGQAANSLGHGFSGFSTDSTVALNNLFGNFENSLLGGIGIGDNVQSDVFGTAGHIG